MKNYKVLSTLIWLGLWFIFAQTSVFAKDDWIRVQSKNFNLIGNASEKNVRKVATKLEQFRETFRLLMKDANFNSSIPTNVVVFKNSSSYKPFKPKRADGKTDEWIAGYFQSGSDVNYITLSTEREDAETFGTIFHEYVHFLVNNNFGKGEVPSWFNEGLAEYYQTFEIEKDQEAKLGLPQFNHLELLRQSKLIPLETLLSVTNYSLKQNGNHSRSIFYAQSWALVHYLTQSAKGAKGEGMNKFLTAILNKVPLEKAFQDSFQMTFAEMEKELKKYISQGTYQYQIYPLKQKLVFDDQMQVLPLSEADSNAYLGDLLFHTQQLDTAETYLQKSLALDPNSNMANASLGMLKIRQRKFDEAKKYLEKAMAGDPKNHMAYYNYAYLLSREAMDEFGYVSAFNSEKAAQMRTALNKAIAINPTFIESYELLGFINLVNNEQLDETVKLLQKSLKYQPGNQEVIMRIAEIMTRQEKFDEALKIADRIALITDEDSIKSRAENLKSRIQTMREMKAYNANAQKQYEEATKNNGQTSGSPNLTRRQRPTEKQLTPEEIEKQKKVEQIFNINQSMRNRAEGEKQIIGKITKITCPSKTVIFTVKTETETVTLSSKDFQSLMLVAYESNAESENIGCKSNLANFNAVLFYKPSAQTSLHLGELVEINFVPNDFRFMDNNSLAVFGRNGSVSDVDGKKVDGGNSGQTIVTKNPPEDFEARRREMMMKAMRDALAQPKEGEKREIGYIEKIECDSKGSYFVFKTSTAILKVKAPQNMQIRSFTPDAGGQQFDCGMKAFDIPAVFIYKEDTNPKAKINGELVSIVFVPKSFKLEN